MNTNKKDLAFILLGVLGSIILLYGFILAQSAQRYYLVGSTLLLLTAVHFKLIYFIALETILLVGHAAIFLGMGSVLQFFLPVLLCIQLLAFYYMSGQLNNIFLLIGISGIALHSIGFSYQNLWIFFFGSIFIAIYSFSRVYKGEHIILLWTILNSLFTLITLVRISIIGGP